MYGCTHNSVLCWHHLQDVNLEDLQNELPSSQPRYVLLSYVYKRDDGRVSYPLCFIFISPQGKQYCCELVRVQPLFSRCFNFCAENMPVV